jgi:putative peptidoglycan lipid II flippase
MLPQGMFSVAVATVLFPSLSRLATRRDFDGLRALTATGVRQIFLLLIPAAACTLALAVPIVRLLYERGEFGPASTQLTAEPLFWFSFSLPFAGANLLLTRTFFSLQRPWLPTALGGATLILNAIVAVALYKPFGVGGIVFGTGVASAAMTAGQMSYLRRELGGQLEGRATLDAVVRICAASALLGAVAYAIHRGLDELVGRSLPGQLVSVGVALAVGLGVYAGAVLALHVPEAQQIRDAVGSRIARRRS